MQKIFQHKGCSIDARSHELADGSGWIAEFYVFDRNDMDTQFSLPSTFPNEESGLRAAIEVGKKKVEDGFEPIDITLAGQSL
ncbi:hypothetical protein Acid345_1096 [Candidatus Koribacter versatilis Ellin345]|uniref:Uncharacterized protein n=1 Tax=Koribacter versatilis (strain Ellin345) TaxID=204669 RepID=Q1ISQ1_KORVE|nr:hypothetical protein [Candidatus Koribacter versatilis]ABF40099.1 hypothetical protein Acid345_1096 [Candidatus Koribacter versatilis Ellin345]